MSKQLDIDKLWSKTKARANRRNFLKVGIATLAGLTVFGAGKFIGKAEGVHETTTNLLSTRVGAPYLHLQDYPASPTEGDFGYEDTGDYLRYRDGASNNRGIPSILVSDGADATSPADTLENTLKTVSIPANSLGANGRIRAYCIVKSTGTNNTKTYRIKFGATTLFSFVDGATSESRYEFNLNIFNRNLTNSQYAWFIHPYNNVAADTDTFNSISRRWNTSAIDTTANQDLVITGQLANSLDSIIISGLFVEIIRT